MQRSHKISVITASKNSDRFLEETLDSIAQQSFTDYEHVVADSNSTDKTLDILKKYKNRGYNIRWESKSDKHADEGFYNAMLRARGEYIMFCCFSDGYLDKDWFAQCVEVLDSDPEVSLVYGLPQNMHEDGTLGRVIFSNFLTQAPPQKKEFLPFWLGTSFVYPELTFCVRSKIFKECFPKYERTGHFLKQHGLLSFNYNFNMRGYLPYFLPIVSSYGRTHHDSISKMQAKQNKWMKNQYIQAAESYKIDVLSGRTKHLFRGSRSNIIGEIRENELKDLHKKICVYQLNRRMYLGKRKKYSLTQLIKKLKIRIAFYIKKY